MPNPSKQINMQVNGTLRAISVSSRYMRQYPPERREATANLLTSAYSAYDRAGRELGIDACALAQSVDLAALVRAAQDALAYLDQLPNAQSGSVAEVAQCGTRYQLRAQLAKIPNA